jgi:hypothetical protein
MIVRVLLMFAVNSSSRSISETSCHACILYEGTLAHLIGPIEVVFRLCRQSDDEDWQALASQNEKEVAENTRFLLQKSKTVSNRQKHVQLLELKSRVGRMENMAALRKGGNVCARAALDHVQLRLQAQVTYHRQGTVLDWAETWDNIFSIPRCLPLRKHVDKYKQDDRRLRKKIVWGSACRHIQQAQLRCPRCRYRRGDAPGWSPEQQGGRNTGMCSPLLSVSSGNSFQKWASPVVRYVMVVKTPELVPKVTMSMQKNSAKDVTIVREAGTLHRFHHFSASSRCHANQAHLSCEGRTIHSDEALLRTLQLFCAVLQALTGL